ncbi:MAG: hypothetical protein C0403_09915, partial [Desulfobacterium sp.]|nr:hypothetical protein [Desulfobacterium sp.]
NRKEGSILSVIENPDQKTVILTNCPSCIQGLGRHSGHHIHPRHIAHELALQVGGEKWENELRILSKKAEVIQF